MKFMPRSLSLDFLVAVFCIFFEEFSNGKSINSDSRQIYDNCAIYLNGARKSAAHNRACAC